jgi:glycosyltransferase involved in cell wall biosynthesis
LASIIQQQSDRWELIAVDDGSTDPQVAQALNAAKVEFPDRVSILKQENAGPGAARNLGTKSASGDYVMYMDSDDELPPYTVGHALEQVQRTGAQLLLGMLRTIRNPDEQLPSLENPARMLAKMEADELARGNLSGEVLTSETSAGRVILKNGPVARVISADVARRIEFPEDVSVSEDTLWNIRLFSAAETVALTESIYYWYHVSHESTSRGYSPTSAREVESMLRVMKEDLANSRVSYRQADVTKRVLGEVTRTVRRYYAHPECPLPMRQRLSEIGKLLSDREGRTAVGGSSVLLAGARSTVKYVLLRTGIAIVLLRVQRAVRPQSVRYS